MSETGASQKVYDFIIERIQGKDWNSGDKILSENELAQELKVSRVAVRQAQDRLVGVGLLKKKQGAGTFVAEFSASSIMDSLIPIILLEKKELRSLLEFRLYFETGNVNLFMQHAGPEYIKRLEDLFKQMEEHENSPDLFTIDDFNFHRTIAAGTENPFIIRISELLTEVMMNHQAHLYENIGPEVGLSYHRKILQAIREGDREMAVLLMRRHIAATIEAVDSVKS